MTSTASRFSNLSNAFKRVFKARLVNTILILSACLGVSLLADSIIFQDLDAYKNITDSTFMLFGVITAITGFYSLANASRMFKEIYKKQSCDAYFSSPISREEYYIANYLYGALVNIACFAIPVVVFLGALITTGLEYDVAAAPSIVIMLLSVLAIYSAFVMCAVISGKRIHYIMLSLICLFAPEVFISGVVVQLNLIWGFSSPLKGLYTISPVQNAIFGIDSSINALQIIIAIVEIICLFLAGLIAFKRRRAEIAEVSIDGKVIPYILLAVLSGAMFFEFGVGNTIIDIVLGIVAVVLACFIFCKIFFKQSFTKQSVAVIVAVCGFCTLLSAFVVTPIFNSYVKYVPDAKAVESVEVSHGNYYEAAATASLLGVFDEDYYEDSCTFKEKENIQKAIDLHTLSVEDDVIKASRKNGNISIIREIFFDNFSDNTNANYTITYKLKNGRTVKRTYATSNQKSINNALIDLMSTKEAVIQKIDRLVNNNLLASALYIYSENVDTDEDNLDGVSYDGEKIIDIDANALKEAYAKDILAMPDDLFAYQFLNGSYLEYYDGLDNEDLIPNTLGEIVFYYADEEKISMLGENEFNREFKELEKMPPEKIMSIYIGYDENYPVLSKNFIEIYSNMTNTINYIKSLSGASDKLNV